MSEQQVLNDWLALVARRLRWRERAALAATLIFWLLLLVLAWLLMRAVVPVDAVMAALQPLWILAALGIIAWAVFHARRRPSLTDAAFAADGLGGLHDQLKSALWFAGTRTPDAGIEVLLARARQTVSDRDPRALVPLRATPMWYGALGAAVLCGVLAWWGPRLAYSDRDGQQADQSTASAGRKSAANLRGAGEGAAGLQAQGQARNPTAGKGAQGNPQQPSSAGDVDSSAIQSAIGDRTESMPAPVAPVAEPGPSRTDVPADRRGTRNAAQETPSEWLGGVVARLKEMLQKGDLDGEGEGISPAGDAQGDARVNPSDRGNKQDLASADPDTQMRNPDNSGGSQLNLNALGGIGPRNTLPGDVAGEEQSGRNNNSNTGPLGRRIGTSRGGPGDGEDELKGDPGGSAESPAVLGRKTVRLALQLRRVPSPAPSAAERPEDEQGSAEEFFAATRAQAARTASVTGATLAGGTAPADVLSAEQTPLAYRGAVKDYFLSQHRKEK